MGGCLDPCSAKSAVNSRRLKAIIIGDMKNNSGWMWSGCVLDVTGWNRGDVLSKQELALKAIATALRVGVDPALVCTIIEVSSGWNAAMTEFCPTTWLRTIEPIDVGGMERWTAMGTRFGPMQILGQEAFLAGWKEVEKLQDLDANLEAGCEVLKALTSKKNEHHAVLLWFGQERKELARKALAMKPQFEKFVEARPHEKTDSVSADALSTAAVRAD